LARWNVAMRLTHSAYSDSNDSGWGLVSTLYNRLDAPQTVGELVDATASQVFGAALTGERRTFYINYVLEGAVTGGDEASAATPQLIGQKYASLFGLMLASPEFQWR
jgi:hypothetical protein